MFPRSKPLKWLLGTLAVLVVAVGLLLGAFRLAMTYVPEYRVQLQGWLNERTGLVVEFRSLRARLRLYGPELVFDDAVVRTPDRTRILATARRGSVAFDLWTSIATGRLTAGRFMLDAPEIGLIRTRDGRIQLVGQSALDSENIKPVALDQLPTGRFQVTDAVVSFRDEITGRGPWSVSGVSFDLRRGSSAMTVQGHASLPRALGESLQFTASVSGALEQPFDLLSRFEMQGTALDLAGWADVFPDAWPAPETGRGTLKVTGEMRGKRLLQLSANVDLSHVTAASPTWVTPLPTALPMQQPPGPTASIAESIEAPSEPDPEPDPEPAEPIAPQLLSYQRIAFDLVAHAGEDDGWTLSLSNIDLSKRDSPWRAENIDLHWARSGERLRLSGKADRVILQNVWPLLAYAPESATLARVRALAATGTIEGASFTLDRNDPQSLARYSLQARFDDLGFAPIGKVPGLAGLSGTVQAGQSGGRVQLDSEDVQFDLPRYFRAPLRLRTFSSALSWERSGDAWQLGSDEVQLQNEDGRAQAKFALRIPDDGSSPVLELTASAQDLDASATHKYLPAGRLSPGALAWLDRAFVAGRLPRAEVKYSGPTRRFPFRGGEGEFLARGRVEDMTFDYRSDWTAATGLSADVEFHNEGMSVSDVTATVGALQIAEASASIDDFKLGNLFIKAAAHSDLDDALAFVRSSPVGPKLGEQFAQLRGQGATNSTVTLRLPLKRLAEREIEVQARLANASASLSSIDAPVTRLTGWLRVRRDRLDAADLQGQWLGGPLHVMVQSPSRGAASELIASGYAGAGQLASVLDLPHAVQLTGATQWRIGATFAAPGRQDSGGMSVRGVQIDADLDGFGIGLPEPLRKRPQDSTALRLDLELDDSQTLLARASLGDVRGLFRFSRRSDSGWTFDRGAVRADASAASLPDHGGLRVEGYVPHFVLDDWLALRGGGAGASDKRLSDLLRAVSVRIGTFDMFGYRWTDLRGIMQATEAGWRVDVDGPQAAGQLVIPEDFGGDRPLTAQLERLTLTRLGERSDSAARSDPRKFPNARIRVDSLQLEAQAIGSVDLRLARVPQGLQMTSLDVATDSMQATMRGSWLQTSSGQRSTLSAQVTSTDVAATLRALNYSQFMEAKRGEIRAELTWAGGLDGKFLGRSSGTLSVSAENGQLLNLQPGAGRVLGLFSVAALPRRMALDFSDLTEKGLSFDTVQGDFELRQGDAYTSNLLLSGPAAEIGIAGRTGLGTRDYDQTAVVTGKLGASLPVAGALAGGPAVGAALLLFSQVFKEPLKGIARGYYRITGPWENPTVERVDAAEVKEATSSRSAPRESG